MTLKRDSMWLPIALVSAVLLYLGGHFELLTKAVPGLNLAWESRIELLSGLSAVIAAWLRLSPLALSPDNAMATRDSSMTTTLAGNPKDGK